MPEAISSGHVIIEGAMNTLKVTHIRDASPSDAAVIVEFNEQLAIESEGKKLDHDVVRAGVKAALDQPALCRYFLAETDGQIVGQTMITYEWSDWRNGVFWWIQSVYVRPAFRHRGVFRTLYEHIASLSRKTSGTCGLRLYVEKDNQQAIETYRHVGMVPTGHLLYERDWSAAVRSK